jgi:hypothetical protein
MLDTNSESEPVHLKPFVGLLIARYFRYINAIEPKREPPLDGGQTIRISRLAITSLGAKYETSNVVVWSAMAWLVF